VFVLFILLLVPLWAFSACEFRESGSVNFFSLVVVVFFLLRGLQNVLLSEFLWLGVAWVSFLLCLY
jgi:hypothetical protein